MSFEDVFLKNNRPYVWIALLAFVVFSQTLFFGYAYLDDNVVVFDKQHIYGNFANIGRAFTEDFGSSVTGGYYYRPMPTIVQILNTVVAGTHPFIYHLTNVLLHVAASTLVFALFLNLRHTRAASLLAASIFAVHP